MEAQALSRPTLLAFYERHRQAFHVGEHVLMWIIVGILSKYVVSLYVNDNHFVFTADTLLVTFQNLAAYYIFSRFVFPKYLYRVRLVPLVICGILIFWGVYATNYLGFNYLSRYTTPPDGVQSYIIKIRDRLNEAGILGCFVSIRLAMWNFAYSMYIVSIFLFFKAAKDIIIYQTRSARSERDKYKLEVDNLQLRQVNTDLELDFLKAQVSPHFLFNTLNSVYARVFDSDEQAADLVLRLSELMRYNLYETDVAKIALDKELGYIQNYLDLERNRLSDQYVVIDYEQSGNPSAYQIAPLLLIAFVENAFKHGVKGATEPAYVQVSATVIAGQFIFQVKNSVPRTREIPVTGPLVNLDSKSGGIGLGNVRRRLDALYKDCYELVVTPDSDAYIVVLTMRLEAVSTMTSVRV